MNDHEIQIDLSTDDNEGTTKRRKSAMISVRLSAEELQFVQSQAEAEGTSVSAYLRNLATRGTVSVPPAVNPSPRLAHASSSKPRMPLMAVFTGYGDTRVLTGA